MSERKETRKYTFTVEGETEMWYFDWLESQINLCDSADYKVSIVAKVQKNPIKYAKSQNTFSTPTIVHVCDIESKDEEHKKILRTFLTKLTKRTSWERKSNMVWDTVILRLNCG